MRASPEDVKGVQTVPAPDEETLRVRQIRIILQDLRVVVRSIQEHSRRVEEQCGLSQAQLWAMWELFAIPGLKVSELSRALTIQPSTASNMLDKLEDKGLIHRKRAGPDQRVVRLYLTETGVSLLANAPRPAQGALNDALQRLPDESLTQLAQGLDALVGAVRIKDPGAALRPLPED